MFLAAAAKPNSLPLIFNLFLQSYSPPLSGCVPKSLSQSRISQNPIRSSPVQFCPVRASSRLTRTPAVTPADRMLNVTPMLVHGTQADRTGLKQTTCDKTGVMVKQKRSKSTISGGQACNSDCALHSRVLLFMPIVILERGTLQLDIKFRRWPPKGIKESHTDSSSRGFFCL